uniref:Uncharacterized protein n=1 Tax=Aureoumbra lagunensis TaxID=44058 RepID=A0A7S3JWN0_9STRA|mmetsp:Transcript_16427/g.21448  ORF Transcript_16427/g.21448 Transcript_16427/m.21448 type:complete len:434 (+) Transcript_16427:27-1328(+)
MPKRKSTDDGDRKCLGTLKVETGGRPLFGLSFWPGTKIKSKQDEENEDIYYFCTVGGNTGTVYAIIKDKNQKLKLEITPREKFVDDDETEEFYTCCWTTAERISDNEDEVSTPLLIVAGAHGSAKIADFTQEPNNLALVGHGNAINDCRVHPIHPWLLVTASKDESARLWNVITRKCIAIFAGDMGHRDEVLTCDIHILGRLLCTAGMDNTVKIWRLDTTDIATAIFESNSKATKPHIVHDPFPVFSTLDIHSNYVDCARFLGNFIISKSTENKIILWTPDVQRVQRVQHEYNLLTGIPQLVGPSSEDNDDEQTNNFTLEPPKWPLRGATPAASALFLRNFNLPHAQIWFMRFALNHSHSFLAAGNQRGSVSLWNLDDDSLESPPITRFHHPKGKVHAVRQVAFSPDSNLLAFCCDDASVSVFDISDLNNTNQ